MRVLLGVLYLVTANFAYQAPTIDVEEHLVQKHASIGRFIELKEHDTLILKCHGRFGMFSPSQNCSNTLFFSDDLTFKFPSMDGHFGFDPIAFQNRVEEEIDDGFGDTVLTITDVRESDTGTYSCVSEEHSSLNDTIHVFVHGAQVFLPLTSVMFRYTEGDDIIVPCKTTKFVEKNDIELYANDALIKSASKNFDQRVGYQITKKLYDMKSIDVVTFTCKHKNEPKQEVDYTISVKENDDLDNDFKFYWDKGFDWPHVGYNYSQTCHLVHNGTKEFAPFYHELHIECDECSNTMGSHVFVERHRLSGNQISTTFRIEHLELEDTATYKCVWNFDKKLFKTIDYELHVAPTRPQIKLIERSPQILRVKEVKQTSLSAKFAVYPLDGESYTATWSRTYNSSIKVGPQSETIITDELRTVSAKNFGNGVFSETLDLKSGAMTTSMSGTYRLSISHMNTSQSVQWEVAIENEQPDVQITVREPSSFIVFNQQFYPPDTHLHIDCVSISIPPADVTFERKNRESGDFEEIDRELLMSVGGNFERGFIWNTTLYDDTELRCTSTRNGNKYTAIKSIIVADEAFTVFSAIEKSDKATSLELPNVIYEGDNVKLTCVVPNGAADWNVSWRFKNNDLESSDTEVKGHSKLVVLDLKDITPSSSGKYQCVVKKGESEEFQEIVLKVESISKPYHTDAESRSTVTVNYDETFVIDCGMTGNPLPDVKWFKDGHPYTSGDMEGSILKVSRARAEDDGQFQCLAVNRAGLTSNFIEVQVDNVPERSSFFYWFLTILVLAAIILICYLFYKLRANKKITKQKDIQLNMLYLMKQNDPGPLPENLKLLPIEERADYLRYPEEFEIARENLEICEKIGSGMFGFVNKGYLSMADPKSQIEYKTRLPVAIKSTKKSFDMELQTMLFEELKIMCAIEKHPNVISLIGAVTTNMRKGEFYLVTEYADNGDLLNYLRKHRETFHNTLIDMGEPVIDENYLVPNSIKKKKYLFDDQQTESTRLLPSGDHLSTSDLLSFALQIANGMEFLAAVPVRILIILTSSNSSISVCPSRFSCTKCIVTSSKICRIADFGLAKRYTDKNYYRYDPFKFPTNNLNKNVSESKMANKLLFPSVGWLRSLYKRINSLKRLMFGRMVSRFMKFSRWVTDRMLKSQMNNSKNFCEVECGTNNRNTVMTICKFFNTSVQLIFVKMNLKLIRYALMKNCWHKSPDVRPNFNTCVHYLKAHLKECAGEVRFFAHFIRKNFAVCNSYNFDFQLLNRVDGQLHLELEEQYKLEEWLMKNRPDIQGGTFTRKPKNNEEEEAPTERYLIVESST
ncbi:Protein CBR-VER-3 [Caenorhabditis briggsae]|uniref:Protein CBR-VER-3 n=1 Tax=Caenorhabditis briggsae TaxID=6238 RepID=A8XR69_CAEBR|nr:Protein CBR-VER-3 [Caenorhabditis briggsae]CAP35166.2 Protein CBR-VER-3 [Caenorhabditis briggsae]